MSIGVVASHAVIGGGGASSAYASEVLADSPLAYWRMGETSGTTITDSSGNGRTGTYSGSVTLGATGLLIGDSDKAVTVSNSVVGSVANAAWMNVNTITVEVWIQPTAAGVVGSREIVCRDFNGSGGTGSQWRIRLNAGKPEALLWHPALTVITAATALTVGSTYHIVFTYDGANMRLYVNGSQVASSAQTGNITTGQPITFGCLGNAVSETWNGPIDEVAVYGTALSSTRIAAHYAAGI